MPENVSGWCALKWDTEVIRRYCDQSREADESTLRAAAVQTTNDEGYQIDSSQVSVSR